MGGRRIRDGQHRGSDGFILTSNKEKLSEYAELFPISS